MVTCCNNKDEAQVQEIEQNTVSSLEPIPERERLHGRLSMMGAFAFVPFAMTISVYSMITGQWVLGAISLGYLFAIAKTIIDHHFPPP